MTGSGSSAAVVKAPAVEQQRPEGEAGGAGEHAAVPDLPADLSILPVIDERLVDDAEEQKDYGADAVPPVDADGVTHTVQPQHYSAAAEGATDDVCSERWGKPGLLTKQQAAALADFKAKQTTEATMGDTEALRYLRARRFDVSKALELLEASNKWRTERNTSELGIPMGVAREMLTIRGMQPSLYLDKNGRPFCVFDASMHTAEHSANHQRILAYMIERFGEGMPAGIAEYTTVFDLRNYTRKNMDLPNVLAGVQMIQVGYPERVFKIVCYKAPRLAYYVYRLVSPFMDKRLRSKIIFAFTPEELLSVVDPTVLPADMGGLAPLYDGEAAFRHFVDKRLPPGGRPPWAAATATGAAP